MILPESITNLIAEFSKLPTVGHKTAERFVFFLLNQKHNDLKSFSEAIINLKKNVHICKSCLAVADRDICDICRDKNRDKSKICVVANTRDLVVLEKTKAFKGYYHVLGGLIDSINGVESKSLKINELIEKIEKNSIREVILALNFNIEGETTSLFIANKLKSKKINVTRLARGLPAGSDLEYADEMTLTSALKNRHSENKK